ncbi:GspE/PulE family protein [Ideonella sp. DXS22W]|uniref:GspE/PulE family protein n=1 Tax=Pseudaquabacterium inlustre TaxID=2984192 RepID=A0ABU9CDU4_9BURK
MATPVAALRLERERWPQPLARRHRALVGVDAQGRWHLLADRDCDALLLQMAETRLGEALRWQRCSAAALDAGLAEGDIGGRALDTLDAVDGPAAPSALHDAEAGAEAGALTLSALGAEASPAVRLLDAVLLDALADGASDIHLEMQPRGAQVRLRIDGVMQAMRQVDGAALAEQVVSRLKVLAELDIGERRLPQDGRFKRRIAVQGQAREIDFRLSIMPSVWGEDAVVRVLDRSAAAQGGGGPTLAALGFEAPMRDALLQLARAPHGLLLVTGPTGSGKTTTLYAALAEIQAGREKIITIEDPVEYQLEGVVQIPVNEKKGLGFARGLRAILRHDPDRVMVGEIRDAETAQIAVQAALTGHGVFSSVHANHAFDVIGRFMHMGLDLYNVVAALNAVLGQRLMRQLCTACAEPVTATAAELARLGEPHAGPPVRLHRPVGCPACHHSGYRGRRAVAELLCMDDDLRDLIAARAPMSAIKQAARERGMQSLQAAALAAVRAGRTSFEEMDRVVAAA